MRGLVRILGNAALVLGGFFIVLFGISKISNHGEQVSDTSDEKDGATGVAYADVPYAQSAYDGGGADSGGSGGSDSGGGGGGSDSGGGGGSK